MNRRVILFCNGAYENAGFYRDYLKQHSFDQVIAVDGGLNFLDSIGVRPDLIIGDLDSAAPAVLEDYGDVKKVRFPAKKNFSDTELALEQALEGGAREIVMAGVTGGRTDHSLDNLFLLKALLKKGVKARIITDNETLFCIDRLTELSVPKGRTVSLIPLTEMVKGVTLTGFEYPLKNACLSQDHPGRSVSNRTAENRQRIALEEGVLLVDVLKNAQ